MSSHGDAGNSNLADRADSEPEKVEARQKQVKGVPKPQEERSRDGLSKTCHKSKADPFGVKQGGTAGKTSRPCNVNYVAGTGLFFSTGVALQ